MTKPILFNTEMVQAILSCRKTATRRPIKPTDKNADRITVLFNDRNEITGAANSKDGAPISGIKPPYQIGDTLYVRETWFYGDCSNCDGDIAEGVCSKRENGEEPIGCYSYKADQNVIWDDCKTHWKPSIHMPKEAARIWLKVTNVRIERLQDITGEEVLKEGINSHVHPKADYFDMNQREMFERLWNSTIKKQVSNLYGYDANPYVWVIEFKKTENTDK